MTSTTTTNTTVCRPRIILDNGIARLSRRSDGALVVGIPGVCLCYVGTSLAAAMAAYHNASS